MNSWLRRKPIYGRAPRFFQLAGCNTFAVSRRTTSTELASLSRRCQTARSVLEKSQTELKSSQREDDHVFPQSTVHRERFALANRGTSSPEVRLLADRNTRTTNSASLLQEWIFRASRLKGRGCSARYAARFQEALRKSRAAPSVAACAASVREGLTFHRDEPPIVAAFGSVLPRTP